MLFFGLHNALKQNDTYTIDTLEYSKERGLSMNNFNPLVSIVIPVYNGSDYLHEAIDSALKQTYSNIEIIVVNDGSIDNTEEIALSYGNRIRYFTKENGGTSTALNMGISNMRGEYFSWLSHDDLYYPRKIEREVETLSKLEDKNTVLLCNWDVIDANYNRIDVILCEGSLSEYPTRVKSQLFHILYAHIHGCAMLVPKKCFDAVGVFDVNLRVAHDYDFFHRILKKFPHKHIPEILVIARDGSNRQGKRASTRCNVEYSLLLIDIIDHLSDEKILEMASNKRDFYLYLRDFYRAAGFTIAGEYMHIIADSLGYIHIEQNETPELSTPTLPRYNIIRRFLHALKRYGLVGTYKKIIVKIFR